MNKLIGTTSFTAFSLRNLTLPGPVLRVLIVLVCACGLAGNVYAQYPVPPIIEPIEPPVVVEPPEIEEPEPPSCIGCGGENPGTPIGQRPEPELAAFVSGRAWAQVDQFLNLTWNDINEVCPVSSGGVCTDGTLNGRYMAGWKWASQDVVNDLFNSFLVSAGISGSDLLSGADRYTQMGSNWAPAFFAQGFRVTIPGEVGRRSIYGWTSSLRDAGTAWIGSVTDSENPEYTDYISTRSVVYVSEVGVYDGAWFYQPGDTDYDGIDDDTDNCPTVSNSDQVNTDLADDGGDACDADDDNDLICDEDVDIVGVCIAGPAGGDNCRTIPNNDQSDSNNNGCGDLCEVSGCFGVQCAN